MKTLYSIAYVLWLSKKHHAQQYISWHYGIHMLWWGAGHGGTTKENYPLAVAILDYGKLMHGKWLVWMVNGCSPINSKKYGSAGISFHFDAWKGSCLCCDLHRFLNCKSTHWTKEIAHHHILSGSKPCFGGWRSIGLSIKKHQVGRPRENGISFEMVKT